jgi:hypothetical protein
MPSQQVARYIPQSLAEQERREDFEYILDTLTRMRRPYHPDAEALQVEEEAGNLVCLLVIIKPPDYVAAMQEFRVLFRGVAETPQLQGVFANSVLPAALMIRKEAEFHYQPSLYFSPIPILTLRLLEPREFIIDPRRLSEELQLRLPHWF